MNVVIEFGCLKIKTAVCFVTCVYRGYAKVELKLVIQRARVICTYIVRHMKYLTLILHCICGINTL